MIPYSYQPIEISLIPTQNSWEAPAYLPKGHNRWEPSKVHVAVNKYWHMKYQAEIVVLALDKAYYWVGKPPTTREDAIALARELYCYDNDLVWQMHGSLDNLAAEILNRNSWTFWWD